MKQFCMQCRHGIVFFFLKKGLQLSLVLFLITYLQSCAPTKGITYFDDLDDTAFVHLPDLRRPEQLITPDDILEIKITGANEVTTQVFNTFGSAGSATAGTAAPLYIVDAKGEIEFPYIGKIKAAGLTRDELKNNIRAQIATYLKDAMVTVRFNNFRFTVLGEVRLPGSFIINNDRVSVLEALGQAGDMTQYAIRNNVMIIRDSSGKRSIARLNFTKKNILSSPFYYLQRNDVVYVETNKNKTKSEEFSRISAVVATLTSVIAITITILR